MSPKNLFRVSSNSREMFPLARSSRRFSSSSRNSKRFRLDNSIGADEVLKLKSLPFSIRAGAVM